MFVRVCVLSLSNFTSSSHFLFHSNPFVPLLFLFSNSNFFLFLPPVINQFLFLSLSFTLLSQLLSLSPCSSFMLTHTHTHTLIVSLMGSWYLALNMTEVWCSGPVPTKAIVHRGGWQIPLKPCQFLCQQTHTHKHTHISDYQAKPDKWGAYRTAGKAWHSSTHGPLLPPTPTLSA